jgi:serine protease Do
MHQRILKPFLWLAILVSIVSIACNLGTAATPSPVPPTQAPAAAPTNTSPPPPPTAAATEAPTAAPTDEPKSGAISILTDAKQAIIQIEAQGTFIDPEVGLVLNSAGRGSGFIIDPSGLAVTNNHVVTGAALIKVRIAGEDTMRNARLVAVSECSDLAVIDIDGDGYPYLDWNSNPIDVGQEI